MTIVNFFSIVSKLETLFLRTFQILKKGDFIIGSVFKTYITYIREKINQPKKMGKTIVLRGLEYFLKRFYGFLTNRQKNNIYDEYAKIKYLAKNKK